MNSKKRVILALATVGIVGYSSVSSAAFNFAGIQQKIACVMSVGTELVSSFKQAVLVCATGNDAAACTAARAVFEAARTGLRANIQACLSTGLPMPLPTIPLPPATNTTPLPK